MTLAVDRLQILDDVSNLIQTRMRDRLRLTTTGRPTIPRFRAPGDRRWLASNECDVCVCVWSPVLRGSFVYTASWRPQLFPIAPHITGAFHRMSAESKDAMKVYTDEQADKGGRDPAPICF
jgi:hypothetical protein